MAFLIALFGCTFNPLDLPLVDHVPIVASDRCAEPREAFVACVLDGDTFDVGECGEGGERIRMLGIDAPEIAHPGNDEECWGNEAGCELQTRIEGSTVLLTFDKTCEGVFGRTLAYVWEIDGDTDTERVSVNQQLVEEGHVRVYAEEFGQIIFQAEYEQSQATAMSRGLGLWAVCDSGGIDRATRCPDFP